MITSVTPVMPHLQNLKKILNFNHLKKHSWKYNLDYNSKFTQSFNEYEPLKGFEMNMC